MTRTRPTLDVYFSRMATLVSSRSTCLRRAVGAVLVNARGHVLATGYNGVASGLPHCNYACAVTVSSYEPPRDEYPFACSGAGAESGAALEACGAIHAEQNALLQCRDAWEIETCYVTHSPCLHCVKMLMNTSTRRIVFATRYLPHDHSARSLWVASSPSPSSPLLGDRVSRSWELLPLSP
jgi:dCMP deaminase